MTYDNSDQAFTRPYSTPTARMFVHNIRHPRPKRPGDQRRLVIAAAIVAATGLVTAAVALAMFLTYKGSAENQIGQMRQQLASAVQQLQAAQAKDAGSYSTLSGKVASLGSALGYLGQFNQSCTQDFTGPNGPAEYWFMCSNRAPG